MKKAVMLSINPKWCKLIESGEKVIEIRKGKPKLEPPFKCYIYQTSSGKVGTGLFLGDGTEIMGRSVKNGTVIGEFTCDRIFPIRVFDNGTIQDYMCNDLAASCVPYDDIVSYIGTGNEGTGWHISNLVIYDTPKALSAFWVEKVATTDYPQLTTMKRPPQSWCYVESEEGAAHGMP